MNNFLNETTVNSKTKDNKISAMLLPHDGTVFDGDILFEDRNKAIAQSIGMWSEISKDKCIMDLNKYFHILYSMNVDNGVNSVSHNNEVLNSMQLVNGVEYRRGGLMRPIYDIFIDLATTGNLFDIRGQLDVNALECKDDKVKNFKLHDYGHGNMHIATCVAFLRGMFANSDIPDDCKDYLTMAVILHDESLHYGGKKSTHHLDSTEIINEGSWDERNKQVLNEFVDPQSLSDEEIAKVIAMVRTHRLSPAKVDAYMHRHFDNLSMKECWRLCSLSVIDKITMFNPLTARCREWDIKWNDDKSYGFDNLVDKIRDRFLDKESEGINRVLFNMILGKEKGEFLYEFFIKVAYDDASPEYKAYKEHIEFIRDPEQSGPIELG